MYFYLSLHSIFNITMDYHNLDIIRATTSEAIKKKKKEIPMYKGTTLIGKQFESGKITILRRSLQDIFEHALDDELIWEWLREFHLDSLRTMKYQGWAPNRPYPRNHPRFDPNYPNMPKHGSDTEYFIYYTIKINKWNYWVNVKMHRDYGEVIYVIEKVKPSDLIRGHKKK